MLQVPFSLTDNKIITLSLFLSGLVVLIDARFILNTSGIMVFAE
jgi:hypothetical protein